MKHKRNLTFGERQYAAMYQVYLADIQGKVVSLRDIADIQNVSKAYARKLLQGWVDAGIVGIERNVWRRNANRMTFRLSATGSERIMNNGYHAIAHLAFIKVRDHARHERIAKVMAI